ncbi:substrate-binding domain-containing protein [Vibrio sp. S4M6]|nr:substrate-binding domain-containing protein [Vibrio sinus]MCL9782721.1 substrate-binding domain-containing protein [Vibrio sinus]
MLGVSQSTVSRAFNPKASISEKKRQMVMEAANKLGYTPNAIARSLISNRSGLIAIALDSESNPMYDMLARKLTHVIQKSGCQGILCPIDEDNLDLAITRAIEYQVDGLIIATSRLSSVAIAQCDKFGVQLSLINRYVEGLSANSVGLDNLDAGLQAAQYLASKGYTKMTYVSGDAGSMTSEERWKGFSKGLTDLGLPPADFVEARYSFESGIEAAKHIVSKIPNTEAIFCANDILALGVIDGLREQGLSVPNDYAVMGVDDIQMSGWPAYNLTTIHQPIDRIASVLVEDLLSRIHGSQQQPGQYLMQKGQLIERASC